MATPTPPKSMSSRLLTMKFMQRAAASPTSSSPSTPKLDEQASKRRKVVHNPTTNNNINSIAQINQAAVQAAIAEEERKRQEALVHHAAELGDARWVLDISDEAAGSPSEIQTPLNVVQVGFAQIDSQIDSSDTVGLDDSESADTSHARTMVRRYNMETKKVVKDDKSGSDDSSSDSDSDSSSEEEGARRKSYGQRSEAHSGSGPSRPTLQRKKSAEWSKAKQFAEARRKKDVNLNSPRAPSTSGGLLSISSGGGTPLRQSASFTCHRCGKPGHKAAECPKRSTR
ncbi:uncharacterized protein GGS22DRAFT_156621 [Annulohypoxylon maeteangense]|uniref:uncharacterized protein n=1 Tax=Annulohypoxylon maeteangense TaxID=1927788 RepID=UPI002008956A|nr:uncharacterized protein GGS22DRAFT_156621 [Annulohypoxylon maeteangense]KAI0887280.1 hypothetical protein GGS22DRAFT_156621 [Annulohypoxylon maeteangense]